MSNQVVIDFPEMDYETYSKVLDLLDGFKVYLWVGETREKIPLKWSGNRICCPIGQWWDFPDSVFIKSDNLRSES